MPTNTLINFSTNSLTKKNIKSYSRNPALGAVFVECFNEMIRNLLKKLVFGNINADWICEISSVFGKSTNTVHSSTKLTPLPASLKENEKIVFVNLQGKSKKLKTNYNYKKTEQLERLVDIKKVSSKGVSTNWSINYIQKVKSYTILYHHIESTIYPRDTMTNY